MDSQRQGGEKISIPGQEKYEVTPEMLARKDWPKAAFYLGSLAGMLMFIFGLLAIFFESIWYAILTEDVWAGLTIVVLGIMLVICALFVSGATMSLLFKPEYRKQAGASMILFSLLAAMIGGFVGGGIGIIGGLLAIIWKPKT